MKQAPLFKTIKKYRVKTESTDIILPERSLTSSNDVAEVLNEIHRTEGNGLQEFFYVLFLNRANKVTGYHLVSIGGVNATIADPRVIFKCALLADCSYIILCHNHPSGQLTPSQADKDLTTKVCNAAKFADIKVLDHIILADDQKEYYSFSDNGLMYN